MIEDDQQDPYFAVLAWTIATAWLRHIFRDVRARALITWRTVALRWRRLAPALVVLAVMDTVMQFPLGLSQFAISPGGCGVQLICAAVGAASAAAVIILGEIALVSICGPKSLALPLYPPWMARRLLQANMQH